MARRVYMAKRWSDAVREQRYGPAPEVKKITRVGRCTCGGGSFSLKVENREWTRECRSCGEVTQI